MVMHDERLAHMTRSHHAIADYSMRTRAIVVAPASIVGRRRRRHIAVASSWLGPSDCCVLSPRLDMDENDGNIIALFLSESLLL